MSYFKTFLFILFVFSKVFNKKPPKKSRFGARIFQRHESARLVLLGAVGGQRDEEQDGRLHAEGLLVSILWRQSQKARPFYN